VTIGGVEMPNGRSGGFPIDTADLKRLVSEVADTTSIGMLASPDGSSSPRLRPTVGAEVLRLVEECLQERVAVEEQDHSSYIIHLSNEPVVWVLVKPDSPIFAGLKQRHGQWEIEHPKWDGWIAF
jgi:hypothetical protein